MAKARTNKVLGGVLVALEALPGLQLSSTSHATRPCSSAHCQPRRSALPSIVVDAVWTHATGTARRSHSRFELSLLHETSRVPDRLTATEVTSPRWPWSVFTHRPDVTSQNLIVLSFDLEVRAHARTRLASGPCQGRHRPRYRRDLGVQCVVSDRGRTRK